MGISQIMHRDNRLNRPFGLPQIDWRKAKGRRHVVAEEARRRINKDIKARFKGDEEPLTG